MMLRFSLSSAIAITAATLLLVTCSALSTRYATSSLTVNRFRLYAGFGQAASKVRISIIEFEVLPDTKSDDCQ